jgi:hypothetical protein
MNPLTFSTVHGAFNKPFAKSGKVLLPEKLKKAVSRKIALWFIFRITL